MSNNLLAFPVRERPLLEHKPKSRPVWKTERLSTTLQDGREALVFWIPDEEVYAVLVGDQVLDQGFQRLTDALRWAESAT